MKKKNKVKICVACFCKPQMKNRPICKRCYGIYKRQEGRLMANKKEKA